MKPKLFIGSSSEALEIANAIQENLAYDAETTVWNQGVFKLSSTALNDLIEFVNNTDFAIFVFNPDDIAIIRSQEYSTVRDNVIFELGLFIGRLGQKNVFYVIPESEKLHLPTDLLGVKPGYYNGKRSDQNILAALGPFCNQVRNNLKQFRYINLEELKNESDLAKKIALERPYGFEYLLLAELIESRILRIAQLHENLKQGIYFVRSKLVNDEEYKDFIGETIQDFQRFINISTHILTEEIIKALGPDGIPSNFKDLIQVSNSIENLSIELFNWETRNEQLIPPTGLSEAKDFLKGASDVIGSQIRKLPDELRRAVKANQTSDNKDEDYLINLKFEAPKQIEEAVRILLKYFDQKLY